VLPLDGGALSLDGGFWGHRQLRNREVTIPHGMQMLDERGSLDNLRLAAGKAKGDYQLPLFMDSDVYKLLEAVAWERQRGPGPEQERFYEQAAALLASVQEPDGYLNSFVQVVHPTERFGDPAMGHELYCAGHLFQAAVAEARSTGAADGTLGPGQPKQVVGPVADRFATYLLEVLPDKPSFVPGHPEVEMALVEMYRQSGSQPLLDLAEDLVRRRGRSSLTFGSFGPEYFQDDVEVVKAGKVRGHAVRALYLLSGVADLYIETGRQDLLGACLDQWDDMVKAKTYLTGGVGSRHEDEAFGDPYELPPDRAYCETCAAIASIMWNWRMCLITGQARFAELIERTLYNGFLAGWGLDGRSFFYVNPLQSRGRATRLPWYRCACCPPNLMRLVASLEHYIATHTSDGFQLHQFAPAAVRQHLAGGVLGVRVETPYPQEGWLVLRVEEAPSGTTDLAVRVPSWAREFSVELNGKAKTTEPSVDGYVHLVRRWEPGDEVSISFPLRSRVVRPDPRIDAVRGCASLERGPFVYCFESVGDDAEALHDVEVQSLDRGAAERAAQVGPEPVVELTCTGRRLNIDRSWPYYEGSHHDAGGLQEVRLSAVPYYAWSNRGPSQMRVWVPEFRR